MKGRFRTGERLRGGALALALLALLVGVLSPSGFMPSARASVGGPGFALVICTGHARPDPGKNGSGAPATASADLCAFAGGASLAASGDSGPRLAREPVFYAEPVVFAAAAQRPGLGLAAPPPPKTGPPAPSEV
jgi:hypothetical protein